MEKLLVMALLFGANSFAQIEKKACFLGNSYTHSHDMTNMVSELAAADGNTLIKDEYTPGGYTLQEHSTNATSLSKISSNDWDFVILQDQSQLPSFPWWQVSEEVLPYAEILADSVRSANECAIPLFFNTWGRRDGDAMWDSINTFTKMNQRLHFTYDYMANKHSGMLAPAGIGFAHVADDVDAPLPHAALYAGDGSHPSKQGSYLTACIFYESIFDVSPIGNTYIPTGVSEAEATYLQNAAHHVLTDVDSVTTRYIDPIAGYTVSFDDLTATFTNTSQHAFSYLWDFGDGETSSEEHPVHTYPDDNDYEVTLTAYYCDREDQLLHIEPEMDVFSNAVFSVYPNPATDGTFTVSLSGNPDTVSIYSADGKLLLEKMIYQQEILTLSRGVYIIRMNSTTQKLIVQ